MNKALLVFALTLSTHDLYAQSKDTFEIRFPLNVAAISSNDKVYIDRIVRTEKKLTPGDKLIVLGYTDYVGGAAYNDTLSMQRATNVRNYLVGIGFNEKDIKLCLGKGKISRTNMASKEGYAPDRKVQIIVDRLEMAKTAPPPPVNTDSLDLSRLEVNQTFALNNIFFKLNQPVLLPTSEPDLKKLLDFVTRYKSVTIQVEGHVCCMGNTEGMDSRYKGRNLSECRAEAIYQYLVDKGINRERMKYVGLGNRDPVVRNEVTEEDKQKNRRVEIRILSK